MINGFKRKHMLFILPIVFISSMTIISCSLQNLVYAQDTNTSFFTYKNSTYGITIKYPHNWSIIDSSGIEGTDVEIVSFLSPNQNDNAIVGIHQDKPLNGNSDIGTYLAPQFHHIKPIFMILRLSNLIQIVHLQEIRHTS